MCSAELPKQSPSSAGGVAPAGLPDFSKGPPPIVRGEPVEIADGIFVIPDNRVDLVPNVGIVVGTKAVLVIDSGLGQRSGAYVLEQAKRLAAGRPLYLTITHFHPEHGFGAQAFKGAATIMYNAGQRDELQRKGPGYIGMFTGMGPAVAAELADVVIVEPDRTYAESEAEIDLGGHRALLRTWGAGHTLSDQTVLVDGRVLFTGDLLETRMFPMLPYVPPHEVDADGNRWIEILGEFLDLKPEIVVPGHGEVSDTTLIRDVRTFLEYVRGEAARLRAAGTSADDTVTIIDKDARARWSTWEHPEWISFAASAFYAASTAA